MNPIKAVSNWMSKRSLASQLYLGFTVAFVAAMLLLVFFLYNAIQVISLNGQAREVMEDARQVYTLRSQFSNLELAINSFEVTSLGVLRPEVLNYDLEDWEDWEESDDGDEEYYDEEDEWIEVDYTPLVGLDAQVQYYAWSSAIDDQLDQIGGQVNDEAILTRLSDAKAEVDGYFDEMTWAADDGDVDALLDLDWAVYEVIPSIDEDIDQLSQSRVDDLDALNNAVDQFETLATIGWLLALPVIALAAIFAALLLANRVNQPLLEVALAARELKAGPAELKTIRKLAARKNEMGGLAQDLLDMAETLNGRDDVLQREAEGIRAKIK